MAKSSKVLVGRWVVRGQRRARVRHTAGERDHAGAAQARMRKAGLEWLRWGKSRPALRWLYAGKPRKGGAL